MQFKCVKSEFTCVLQDIRKNMEENYIKSLNYKFNSYKELKNFSKLGNKFEKQQRNNTVGIS